MKKCFSLGLLPRILFVVGGLLLIWDVWTPVYKELPRGLAVMTDINSLRHMPTSTPFVLSGTVHLMNTDNRLDWQQRIAYLHRQRRDLGGTSKSVQLVTVMDYRPALEFVVGEQNLVLPAESYSLDFAPRVTPRLWPRKWLWSTPVDDWDRSSRGLAEGDQSLALGRIGIDGELHIDALMQASLESVREDLGNANKTRWWLIIVTKLLVTVFLISLILPGSSKRRI